MKRKIQNKFLNISGYRSGFTLAEFIVVVGILLLLFTLSLRGLVNSQRSFLFNNTAERVIQMVREARSLAVTGKAQRDYTDSDRDNLSATTDPGDFVAPAHYGIQLDAGSSPQKVILFFDVNEGESTDQTEGEYNEPSAGAAIGAFEDGKDVKLAEFTLDDTVSLITDPNTVKSIMFTPIFADTSFNPPLAPGEKVFVFGVKDTDGIDRKRCFKIHVVAGVPEVADSTDSSEC